MLTITEPNNLVSIMTFYAEQLEKMTRELYSKEYLTSKVIHAKQYIDIHFAESINLHELGVQAFISKFHFIRLFKSIYGTTPHQYLITVRIARAKQLLTAGNSISETCMGVGFNSTTSFTALFKKITGVTPTAFKNSNF